MSNDNKHSVTKPNPTVKNPNPTIQRPAPLGTIRTFSLDEKGKPVIKSVVNNKGGK